MSAVSRLTTMDYEEIRDLLCPFCRAGLPDERKNNAWLHSIPGTLNLFGCTATGLRNQRYKPVELL